jgi:hypothetical protein
VAAVGFVPRQQFGLLICGLGGTKLFHVFPLWMQSDFFEFSIILIRLFPVFGTTESDYACSISALCHLRPSHGFPFGIAAVTSNSPNMLPASSASRIQPALGSSRHSRGVRLRSDRGAGSR